MPCLRVVTSKSNLKHVHKVINHHDLIIVDKPPDKIPKSYPKDVIFAFGGGSVIDTAKMMAMPKACIAIPTTASGAATTSWAVVWGKKTRKSISTMRPVLWEIYRTLKIELPADVIAATYADCLSHIIDSRSSQKANAESLSWCDLADSFLKRWKSNHNISDLIDAGNFAGRAIEITGTNYLHALSYVLTFEYGFSHGDALRKVLLMDDQFDWSSIIKKAKKYPKFHERLT